MCLLVLCNTQVTWFINLSNMLCICRICKLFVHCNTSLVYTPVTWVLSDNKCFRVSCSLPCGVKVSSFIEDPWMVLSWHVSSRWVCCLSDIFTISILIIFVSAESVNVRCWCSEFANQKINLEPFTLQIPHLLMYFKLQKVFCTCQWIFFPLSNVEKI